MERKFRLDFVDGIMDRLAPAMRLVLPFSWMIFAILVFLRLNFHHVWSSGEILITSSRIVCVAIATVLFYSRKKSLFGKSLLWINRLGYFLMIGQQSGVHQHDANFKLLMIWLLFFGGSIASSFEEYVISSFIISYTKSICLWTVESMCSDRTDFECTNDGKEQELLHASILLGMALFINFHLYGDYRRAWLFRCAKIGMTLRSLTTDDKETPSDLLALQWDLHLRRISDPSIELDVMVDGYFSSADREQLRDTVRAEAADIVASTVNSPPPDIIKVLRIVGAGSSDYAHLVAVRCDWTDRAVRKRLQTSGVSCHLLLDRLRAVEGLRHPNVARCSFAEGDKKRSIVLLQEYCDGRSLAFLIAAGQPASAAAVQHFAAQAASGLAYLHRHCIVHNNLKPSNCLLTADATLKLADYGPASGGSELLEWRPLHATLLALPPEAFRVGPRGRFGDVWSLGCVILELFTLRNVMGEPSCAEHSMKSLASVGEVR